MILVVSRFRVTNGREDAVRDAFFNRPHLVDKVAGFLGMEVFTAAADPAYFYLLTRWTDIDSYRTWHSSDAHRLSHKGIPRGLKLDRTATEVTILHRLNDPARQSDLADFAADAVPLLAQHLATTQATCLFLVSPEGKIRTCNGAGAALVKIPADQLVGESFWRFLPEADGLTLRQRIQQAPRDLTERFFINVIDVHSSPSTLECYLDVQPDGFILLGEAPRKQDDAFQQEMIRLNNDLAVVTRESARKSRALETALSELKEAQARLVHQEKMASLGQLTAGIAHEINNPIAFVLNNQSTLERDFEDLLELINVVGDSLKEMTAACPVSPTKSGKKPPRSSCLTWQCPCLKR